MVMRIERALDMLEEKRLECGIVLKPENVYYLTGFFPSSDSALLLKSEPLLLVSKMDSMRVENTIVETRVVDKLKDEFKDLKYRKIGVEKEYASIKFYEKYLKGKKVSDLDFIEKMRQIKDKKEVEKIGKAIEIAEGAMEEISNDLEDKKEIEVAAVAGFYIRKKAQIAFDLIVASGGNSAIPHHVSGNREIKAGDPVIVDLGARVGHYNSDITRTFCLDPVEDFFNVYDIVLEAQRAGIREAKAGNRNKNVDIAVRKVLEECGVEEKFLHSSGHGIGLEVHEAPKLAKDEKGVLEKGMVITIEPGVYKEFGVRIEDVVLVGKRPKVMSSFRK